MMENQHITGEMLEEFQHNRMKPKEKEEFLEHICSCDFCSRLFAEDMSYHTVNAPQDLKMNILTAVRKPEIQLGKKVAETSKRMQLFWYSLKVGAATAGALAILILTVNLNNKMSDNRKNACVQPQKTANTISFTAEIKENMDSFSSKLSDFSNSIMGTEGINHEKKEK